APAIRGQQQSLPVDEQRFRHRVVMIIEASLPHTGVLRYGVVRPYPAPCCLGARIRAADPAVQVTLQAGVRHAAIRPVLAGLTLAVRRIDETSIVRSSGSAVRPRLIVALFPVLAALEENDRLLPEGGAAGK